VFGGFGMRIARISLLVGLASLAGPAAAVAAPESAERGVAGRCHLPRYDLVHPLFGSPSDADGFVIQPVTTSGLAAELPEPPC
jgi:hypothetical protein